MATISALPGPMGAPPAIVVMASNLTSFEKTVTEVTGDYRNHEASRTDLGGVEGPFVTVWENLPIEESC